jgi:hypothetical protein
MSCAGWLTLAPRCRDEPESPARLTDRPWSCLERSEAHLPHGQEICCPLDQLAVDEVQKFDAALR